MINIHKDHQREHQTLLRGFHILISSGALVYTPLEEHTLQIQWIANQSNENPRQQ